MNMEGFISLIGNVVFPIAVSLYLLIRIEGKLENLTTSINTLSTALNTFFKSSWMVEYYVINKKSHETYNLMTFDFIIKD